MNSINQISDYPALRKLAAALWRQDNSYHGAAVMVGAGFSRCAASTGDANKRLPLWSDLSGVIAQEIGARSDTDALRLAEEYSAYFGKQALYDLVKSNVNDLAWKPGRLYTSLLQLPWTEVLTTNWDTLLERAALTVNHPIYNLVSKQEDLSSARSPRIVKLHGTVNVTQDLVFTQEEFRRYPERNAAFVNFARQVFIENELCLLGFSGDDPNFLQWAGWVRDQLATKARRIYLVGVLNLTAAKRKYLESLNVAAIDLAELVADYDSHDLRHSLATQLFLEELQKLKPTAPWEWTPTSANEISGDDATLTGALGSSVAAVNVQIQRLPYLQSDRMSYPGWLVCPPPLRWEVQVQTDQPFMSAEIITSLDVENRARLLYEVAWRHSVTFDVIPDWLAQEMLLVAVPGNNTVLSKKEQVEIAMILLRNSRWLSSESSKKISEMASSLIQQGQKHWQEHNTEVAYHNAILARDQFDYKSMESLVSQIVNDGNEWRLRKASLLAELGRFDEGEELIAAAHRELRSQYRNDPGSIYILSRLAWAHFLLRGIKSLSGEEYSEFPSDYQKNKCDPWQHIEDIREKINKAVEQQQKRQRIEPLFEPGSYRDNSNSITYSNEIHPYLLLDGISNTVGVPLRWNTLNLFADHAARLTDLDSIDEGERFSLAIRAANSDASDVLKKVFSRVRIACLEQGNADHLMQSCINAIEYWKTRLVQGGDDSKLYALERLRVFIEVLARITVRATEVQAMNAFKIASELAKRPEFQHPWLADCLHNLTKYALESIPESEHGGLLLNALQFPLQSELRFTAYGKWANPIIKSPWPRAADTAIDRRIDEIIDSLEHHSQRNAPALTRLLPLAKAGFLTDFERSKIAEKIWGAKPDFQKLPETGLFAFALLALPAGAPESVREIVREYLFCEKTATLFNTTFLRDITGASTNAKELPSPLQALDYFQRMVIWRGKPDDPHSTIFRLTGRSDKPIGEHIGRALASAVIPAMTKDMLTEERFSDLLEFNSAVYAPELLIALPYFAVADEKFSGRVEKIIRQALQERDVRKLSASAYSLLKWKELNNSAATSQLSMRLINIVGTIRMNGLVPLLAILVEMHKSSLLSSSEYEALTEVLPIIFDNADYRRNMSMNEESSSASLVRAGCVRLARGIYQYSEDSELQRLLDEAKIDALPEVRFALND